MAVFSPVLYLPPAAALAPMFVDFFWVVSSTPPVLPPEHPHLLEQASTVKSEVQSE